MSRAVGEGRHSHFLRRERKKTSAHSLTSYLHIHSCLALCLGLFARASDGSLRLLNICERRPLPSIQKIRFCQRRRRPVWWQAGGSLSLHWIGRRTSCLFDVSVEIRSPAVWIFSHAIGLTLFDLCEERPGGWEGSVEKISMKLAVQ